MAETEKRGRSWKQDPEAVRADILAAARAEFAEHGLSGARVDRIVRNTATSKRMVFYYYGDKEGLYRAVLEEAYARVRAQEEELDLEGLDPDAALRRLVRFTFDHHRANPDFIRLVAIENVHRARHLLEIPSLAQTNRAVIDKLERICAAGIASGLFRSDVSALRLHWQISALCFFNISNRATFGTNFGNALFEDAAQDTLRDELAEMILGSVRAT
ncbi:TetR/AcrR family transcriptional regulator [Roseivivax marinus]|uniref:TetR/AcrR family transcriptional regulator n=1 Tax=Roseivivax marinus TaxID=1379903 RepID=UPI00273F5A3C|nr:TetR/AcrR family transcriptional regulator [Roseivivax marinus]